MDLPPTRLRALSLLAALAALPLALAPSPTIARGRGLLHTTSAAGTVV